MAGGCPLTCYSFIKHCLCVPQHRGEHVTLVMNDQRVTSSLLTLNTGVHAHTQTYIKSSMQSCTFMLVNTFYFSAPRKHT